MPDPLERPKRDYANTYFVQDRSSQDELTRVQIQDHMLTAGMGGVLVEQPDPSLFKRVLDVGCGAGGWLIETARTYPNIELLIGVDASRKAIDFARAQAVEQGVSDRVEFHIMDALLILEFPSSYFDLVNQRLALSWLRSWEWPKILREYQRVTRPEGIVRITESKMITESSSPALVYLNHLTMQALHQAGNFFTATPDGVAGQLAHLLEKHGFQQVQTRLHALHYHAGTPESLSFYEDARLVTRTTLPFLRKWIQVPANYEEIRQQMLDEMRRPDFVATWNFLTAWGSNSPPQ